MKTAFAVAVAAALAVGCSGGSVQTDGGSGGGAAGGGTGGGAAGGGTGGGAAGGGSGGGTAAACPHVVLDATTLPIDYQGDTTNLPNWVTSTRLEWTDAPDDSLQFVVPSTGNYAFTISSTNASLGVSIKNADDTLHALQGCPAAGATSANDGMYESPAYPAALTAGQTVLIWISAPSWAPEQTGTYTLTIARQ